MTKKQKLQTIANHVEAINRVCIENNIKIPSIIKVFITRIHDLAKPRTAREVIRDIFNIH